MCTTNAMTFRAPPCMLGTVLYSNNQCTFWWWTSKVRNM